MEYLNRHYDHLKSIKLDLGCGLYCKEGFIGLDNFAGIKAQTLKPEEAEIDSVIRHNLEEGIPFEPDSVDEVITSHFIEHVNDLDKFFGEIYRVLKDGRTLEIIVPYANSAEGMYPGHKTFFTEKWFFNNISFNNFFKIKKLVFYESDYYHLLKEKINKVFTFAEARTFLFNCCWQMQIFGTCRKSESPQEDVPEEIEYITVPYNGTISKGIKINDEKPSGILSRLKNLLD